MRRLTTAGLFTAVLGAALPATPYAAAGPGEALFRDGAGAQARLLGGVIVPATRFACAGCHGADGQGGREGATDFPAVAWDGLAAPGRPGGSYDASALIRAVTQGLAPDGRALGAAMPRYLAPEATLADLVAFLQGLGAAQTAGITAAEIRIGRPQDPAAALGMALAVARIAEGGAIFGRRIAVAESGPVVLSAAALAEAAAPAIGRATADRALAVLRAEGIAEVDPGPSPSPELAAALREAGVVAAPGAGRLLCLGAACPADDRPAIVAPAALPARLAPRPDGAPPGQTRLVALARSEAGALIAAGGDAAAAEIFLAALALEPALAACGRAVTRACLLDALPRADLSAWLALYDR